MIRRGGDFSWSRPDPSLLVAAGWTFVVRYVSEDLRISGGRTKVLNRTEAEALSRAGLDIVLVWEGRSADRDPLKGYDQGVLDAREAHLQALECGAPDDVPIYFAVDWDARAEGELVLIVDYLDGAADGLGARRRVGVYGSYAVVERMFSEDAAGLFWQTYAWSGTPTKWSTHAQLRQTLNGQQVGGGAVDLDEAHADRFGQWRLDSDIRTQ